MKVTVGKAEDPWCEIDLTEEDVEEGATCRVSPLNHGEQKASLACFFLASSM